MNSGDIVVPGERVVLREKRLEDARDDYAWRVDDELSRLDATAPIRMSFEEFLRFYREEMGIPSPWSCRFSVDTLDGKHIGNVMFYDIDLVRKQAEMGIMVGDKEYWSQGYGTDAVNTLTTYVFTQTPIRLFYLHTLEWNQRARKSFAKSGFREVGPVRRGKYQFIRMELTRDEWLVTQAAQGDHIPTGGAQGIGA
ncbi:MAG: N-acetyltransferase [Dehalococcoidia bacterium]|nr:N-acetyltransferase [Dehalococcoidia bacterium]